MRLKRLLCLINRHTPIRHRVEIVGSDYIGTCRRCGAPIYRKDHRDWRKRGRNWSPDEPIEA